MPVVFTLLILSFIGTLGARQPDIDINRIKLLPKEDLRYRTPTYHRRRSIITDQYSRRNDYLHNSRRVAQLRTPMHFLNNTPSAAEASKGKTHEPREDPRFYYQSHAYLQKINRQTLDNEVSSIYPGRGEVRAGSNYYRAVPNRKMNELNSIIEDLCIRCPHDRTLIAKPGLDRALLQYPNLQTCTGWKPPRDTHFVHMYGPKFGTLVKEGSHMVIGRIVNKGNVLQTCKMQIHVLIQSCPVPKYLITHCADRNRTCSFTCRNSKSAIRGAKSLRCGDDMKWSGRLPVCSTRTWCMPPPPPDHGQVTCQGITLPDGRLTEGARCRLRCDQGWRRSPPPVTICRRGLWSHELSCQSKLS